jgi:peptidoglycan/xylan/chitin deacetylase (PgdA/CDA1 family)
LQTLDQEKIQASFFLTGNFYRHPGFRDDIRKLKKAGHYLGAHSDRHLLYCDWTKRDSLLVTHKQFTTDLEANYSEMKKFGIQHKDAPYFLPPYEWYNDSIVTWTREMNLTLINFSPGTISHADYTTPDLKNYRSSEEIFQSIVAYEKKNDMNGFILLTHIGVGPARKDKFYLRLEAVIKELKKKGYRFLTIDDLLEEK